MARLSIEDVLKATGGELVGEHPAPLTGVSIDSRETEPGQLFIPLRGERTDGHEFIAHAMEGGAGASLVEEGQRERWQGLGRPLVVVKDALTALQDLAAYWRGGLGARVIGITGSNGKTTTKDMLAAILSRMGSTLKSPGNYNNEIGLPLTLLQADAQHDYVVLEMGMRGLGEIRHLTSIARPCVGVVTNVGQVHLELLGSLENIARAKGELVEALGAKGIAVLNADDQRVAAMGANHQGRIVCYGVGGGDVRAREIKEGPRALGFTLYGTPFPHDVKVSVGIPGRHNVHNALAAAACAAALGADPEAITAGLASFEPTEMRLQIEELPCGATVLNDAYNASPASMQAALETLRNLAAGFKIAVLGDMLELGPQTVQLHRAVGKTAAAIVDYLVVVGPLGAEIAQGALSAGLSNKQVAICSDNRAVLEQVASILRPGVTVLVKGSRGMRLEEIVEGLRKGLVP
ncbi:MAG: UDP-N-acetylmuramoyl-tripeptide--D-alanyl-D-alanine ligase [Limnochordia bacterium]